MDVVLGPDSTGMYVNVNLCLNPCFNGCGSRTVLLENNTYALRKGLNPCFNGCGSRTIKIMTMTNSDFSLNPCFNGCGSRTQFSISIPETLMSQSLF